MSQTMYSPVYNNNSDTLSQRRRIQILESENRNLMSSQGKIIQETNRRVQTHMNEIKLLKEENAQLSKENSELRDLCCFLDDDRERTRRLSREWQRFGRYTAGVMKQEVATYQAKLNELEKQQKDLIAENNEMKQLCLFLDDQRKSGRSQHEVNNNNQNIVSCPKCDSTFSQHNDFRGDGDGSSGRSSDTEPLMSPSSPPDIITTKKSVKFQVLEDGNLIADDVFTEIEAKEKSLKEESLLSYIRSLESRVKQLEEKKRMELSQSTPHLPSASPLPNHPSPISQSSQDISNLHITNDPLTVSQESGKSCGTSTVYGSEKEEELSDSSFADEDGVLTPIEEETDESDSALNIPYFTRRPALRNRTTSHHSTSHEEEPDNHSGRSSVSSISSTMFEKELKISQNAIEETPEKIEVAKVVWKTMDATVTNSRDFKVAGTTKENTGATVL